eukprot:s505_g14.t1
MGFGGFAGQWPVGFGGSAREQRAIPQSFTRQASRSSFLGSAGSSVPWCFGVSHARPKGPPDRLRQVVWPVGFGRHQTGFNKDCLGGSEGAVRQWPVGFGGSAGSSVPWCFAFSHAPAKASPDRLHVGFGGSAGSSVPWCFAVWYAPPRAPADRLPQVALDVGGNLPRRFARACLAWLAVLGLVATQASPLALGLAIGKLCRCDLAHFYARLEFARTALLIPPPFCTLDRRV